MIGFSPATFDISEPKTVPTLVSFSTIYWIYGSLIVLIVINVKLSLKVFTAPSLVRWPTAGCWGEILNFPATLSPVSRVPGAAPGPECSLWPLNITASKLRWQWVFLRSSPPLKIWMKWISAAVIKYCSILYSLLQCAVGRKHRQCVGVRHYHHYCRHWRGGEGCSITEAVIPHWHQPGLLLGRVTVTLRISTFSCPQKVSWAYRDKS